MGKSIDERSHEAIRAYLRHRGIEVLEEGWAHGSDSIDFITASDEELVFVDAAANAGATTCPARSPTRSASSASQRPTSSSPRWRASPASATTS